VFSYKVTLRYLLYDNNLQSVFNLRITQKNMNTLREQSKIIYCVKTESICSKLDLKLRKKLVKCYI